MVEIVVDYQNMQFMIRKNGKYTMDNPLPVEVQRAVILQIIEDVAESFRRQLRHQLTDESPGLMAHLIH